MMPHRDGVLEAQRATDGDHDLALAHPPEVGEGQGRKIGGVHLEQRKVEVVGETHDGRRKHGLFRAEERRTLDAAIRLCEGDLYALRPLDDVGVGHDVAGRVDDDTGSESLLTADHGRLARRARVHGAVAGDENLHDGGRHLGRDVPQLRVELAERAGRRGGGLCRRVLRERQEQSRYGHAGDTDPPTQHRHSAPQARMRVASAAACVPRTRALA
jgi:hypothetical protein